MRKKPSAGVDLRAKDLESLKSDLPSVSLLLARTEHMLKFFRKVHPARVYLNDWIMRVDEDRMRLKSQGAKLCKIGEGVDNCGSVACVGGHVTLQFAPANWKYTVRGELRSPKGKAMGRGDSSVTAYGVAMLLMGNKLFIELMNRYEGDDILYPIYDAAERCNELIEELFDSSGETSQLEDENDRKHDKKTAINRLVEFKDALESLQSVLKIGIKDQKATVANLEAAF